MRQKRCEYERWRKAVVVELCIRYADDVVSLETVHLPHVLRFAGRRS